MTKRDTLLRLYQSLMARRDELRRRLGGKIRDLSGSLTSQVADSAQLAFEDGSEELSSSLAEMEARELGQMERALVRLRQGTYGTCEYCQKKIPVARLNALPFGTTCVKCQKAMETRGAWGVWQRGGNWENVARFQPVEDQPEIDIRRMELEMAGGR